MPKSSSRPRWILPLVLIALVGVVLLGMAPPRQGFGFLVTLVLTAVCLFSLGLCVAAVARTGRSAAAIGNALFFPLAFFAGHVG